MNICQGKRRVSDYAIEFRTLSPDSGWNTSALIDVFLHCLSAPIEDQFIHIDLSDDLDALIALTIKIDNG